VAGVLTLVVTAAAASTPLITSHSHRTPIPAADAGPAAPVLVIPASDRGSSTSLPVNDHPAPVAAPAKNAEGIVASGPAAAAPQPRVTRNNNRIASPPTQHGTTTPPPPRTRATSPEDYLWSQAGTFGRRDGRWAYLPAPRR
jgi:hypothetical protein